MRTQKMTTILITAVLSLSMLLCIRTATAQFTFNGGYDPTWGTTNGYTIDPTDIIPELEGENAILYTAQLLPDGSILAGGRLHSSPDFFYVKKYTPTGAVDTSFGTGGIALVNFFQRIAGSHFDPANGLSTEAPAKLVIQPDGKILFGGQCTITAPPGFRDYGQDACLIRLNANGSIDTSFGNNIVFTATAGGANLQQWPIGQGRLMFQTAFIGDGALFGTGGTLSDIAVQPDGKIVVVGYTRDHNSTFSVRGWSAFMVRLNPDGSPDVTFGTGGLVRYAGSDAGQPGSPCWTEHRFYGVKLQPDGRILALGHAGANAQAGTGCMLGSVFSVTRWTANGILETERLQSHINTSGFGGNAAFTAAFVKGNKVLVSGSNADRAVMTRLHLSNLTVDTTFAANGTMEYLEPPTGSAQRPYLLIEQVQSDGKILGRDNYHGDIVRFNANGTSDQSFGNRSWNDVNFLLGRAGMPALFPNGQTLDYAVGSILLRPNGRINLIGYQGACYINGSFHCYAIATQQNTSARNGNYSDFSNDGRSDVAVYRPSVGAWYRSDSASGAFSGINFGVASDLIAPADYDGDGKTDVAIFRNGDWWILRSSTGQAELRQFGTAGDLPRPGDYDGDGFADLGVFRPSTGMWYKLHSSDGTFASVQWGASGDAPVLGDFDGDGRTDTVVFRNGVWYLLMTTQGFKQVQFGIAGDIPVAGDYDADSKADIAVFRAGVWYIQRSSDGQFQINQWGLASDRPVPGDYDNDGKTDVAVYRDGTWWMIRSTNGSVMSAQFGVAGDTPIPAAYLP